MKLNNLSEIEKNLQSHAPKKVLGRRWMQRASVAALLTKEDKPKVVLMRRPIKKGDPWSGDMCFPGGRKEAEDKNSYNTAVRETLEEVGLDLAAQGTYMGRLSDVTTRAHATTKPMVVTPFVFSIASEQQLGLSEEAKEIIAIPIEYLVNPANRKTMDWRLGGVKVPVPCYYYQGARVWGLTLMMLDELLRLAGGNISRVDSWLRMLRVRR